MDFPLPVLVLMTFNVTEEIIKKSQENRFKGKHWVCHDHQSVREVEIESFEVWPVKGRRPKIKLFMEGIE